MRFRLFSRAALFSNNYRIYSSLSSLCTKQNIEEYANCEGMIYISEAVVMFGRRNYDPCRVLRTNCVVKFVSLKQ